MAISTPPPLTAPKPDADLMTAPPEKQNEVAIRQLEEQSGRSLSDEEKKEVSVWLQAFDRKVQEVKDGAPPSEGVNIGLAATLQKSLVIMELAKAAEMSPINGLLAGEIDQLNSSRKDGKDTAPTEQTDKGEKTEKETAQQLTPEQQIKKQQEEQQQALMRQPVEPAPAPKQEQDYEAWVMGRSPVHEQDKAPPSPNKVALFDKPVLDWESKNAPQQQPATDIPNGPLRLAMKAVGVDVDLSWAQGITTNMQDYGKGFGAEAHYAVTGQAPREQAVSAEVNQAPEAGVDTGWSKA